MRFLKIGKDKGNDIYKDFINDPTVSRNHCKFFEDDEGNVFLTDLNSTNGTFVNGNKISKPVLLESYDIVRAGNSLIKWKEYFSKQNKINKDFLEEPNQKSINQEPQKKKNKIWLLVLLILIILSILAYYNSDFFKISDNSDNSEIEKSNIPLELDKSIDNITSEDVKIAVEEAEKRLKELEVKIPKITEKVPLMRPKNGYSPYDYYFGKGIYNNSSIFVEIDNQTNLDAVVLLVNSYSEKKIRNEYIRKKTKFRMTGIPDGTYYIRTMMGDGWDSNLKVGPLKGGFVKNRSISGNSDHNDWMKLGTKYANSKGEYTEGYSQTLHGVVGGDIESESLTSSEFAK